MSATQNLLALAMQKTGAASQAELAEKCGLSKQMVSFYISGRSRIQSPEHIAALCIAAGEDPELWFAELAGEATTRPEVKAWARRLGAAIAVIVIAALPATTPAQTGAIDQQVGGIMRSLRRWLRNAFTPLAPRWTLGNGSPTVLA